MVTNPIGYAQSGWPVFPVQASGKKPLTAHGFRDASTDEQQIRAWWERWPSANIGLATGKASGIIVLDVDAGHGGFESLAKLEAAHGPLLQTVMVHTGGGGRHYWFRYPGVEIRNAAGLSGYAGLDIRGDGGYVVTPPSVHESGNSYTFAPGHAPGEIALAEIPGWLLDLMTKPKTVVAAELTGYIANGQRNVTLFSMAGSLRRKGLSPEAILAALRTENALRCSPPLEEGELQSIVHGITRYPPGGEFRETDAGNALRLVAQHGHDIRYCHMLKRWLIWTGRNWEEDKTGAICRLAKATAKSVYAEAAAECDESRRKSLAQWALRSESRERIEAMIRLAQSEAPVIVRVDELDRDEWLLNCANGTLDLRTGILNPHRREDMLTRCIAVGYDPAATCPLWLDFLDRIMDGNSGMISFLQRALGYSLTGSTREQCLFLLHGSGANGKSTLLDAMSALMGEYGRHTPTDTLMVASGLRQSNDLARLQGARFVTAMETEDGKQLAESLVKQVTGGDTVSARYMYAEYFEFKPQFKIWLGANHKPDIRGQDHAIWRRIHLILFGVTIPEEERDRDLSSKLKAELPGILAWMMQGCLTWQHMRLNPPPEVKAAGEEYRREQDTLEDFIGESCVLLPAARTGATPLYMAYKAWCERNGEKAVTQTRFGRMLKLKGLDNQVRDRFNRKMWSGIGLRETVTEEAAFPDDDF